MTKKDFDKVANRIFPVLDKELDISAMEAGIRSLWEEKRVYEYVPDAAKPTFSVDTPPPYVSAAHLHVGHAMSYTQAEVAIRYKRMKGYNIFYPMGFDDNGLPTERYVEKTYNIDKRNITRADFRALCVDETKKGAKEYEKLWRALGLSVDWELRYSTIDDRSRHTAQKSFLDLYNKGLLYRANEPVLWDTSFETSLAQADLETITRKSKLYAIDFSSTEGQPLTISTTRPELIPACVALFVNPNDERYKVLIDGAAKATVPLFGHEVPVLASEDVDPQFGTGLMMVCTFGDGEDVKKWKQHKLDTRQILTPSGRMNELAGPYVGLKPEEARKRIVNDLTVADLVRGEKAVEQHVSVGERSESPVEFIMAPQWFINVLGHKDRLLNRAEGLNWAPDWMKVRLTQWIEGLKYDWNISRQRFYGVPFPVWYVKETGDIILADEKDLPVDPMECEPPEWAKEKYKGLTITPEADVMDTWMTSSLSPLINANWAGRNDIKGSMDIYPMSLRVQAFEIIRTWLFYTLVKSDYHMESLPWKDVMISGWGLNEQGKKVSKRDLEKYTDASGYNRYDPYSLIGKYGADALRYWASNSQLGHDLRFNERDVKDGRKIVVKLWNVARMCFLYMDGFDPAKDNVPFAERPIEDQWMLSELNAVTEKMTESFERYDYATAKESLNKFFWMNYCDDYLEMVKGRFWDGSDWSDKDKKAAQCTLHESLRTILGLFAPFLPYVTEHIYQKAAQFNEPHESLHTSVWPGFNPDMTFDYKSEMDVLKSVLYCVRKLRSDQKIGSATLVDELVIDLGGASEQTKDLVEKLQTSLCSAARATRLSFGEAGGAGQVNGVRVAIIPYPEGAAPNMTTTMRLTM